MSNEFIKRLIENYTQNLKESDTTSFFETKGLNKAVECCLSHKVLNCCNEVCKDVKELSDCPKDTNIVQCQVYTADNSGTAHVVLSQDNRIIDYTQKQFFGSNNPNDVKCDIIQQYSRRYFKY